MGHHGETVVTQSDLNSLARRLDDLNLQGTQKALLSAIVTAAGKVAAATTTTTVPSFHDQFAKAFTPEKASHLIAITEDGHDIIDRDHPPRND